MEDLNEKVRLNDADYTSLLIETMVNYIPVAGPVIHAFSFGIFNEKRLKRIECMYQQLKEQLASVENLTLGPTDLEKVAGFVEIIHDEVEKAKSKDKVAHFVNYYKNLLLGNYETNLEIVELYLEILSKLTIAEIRILAYFYRNRNWLVSSNIVEESPIVVEGSLNFLADYKLLLERNERTTFQPSGIERNYSYKISEFGITFCQYILS